MHGQTTRRLPTEAFVGFVMALFCLAAFIIITGATTLTTPPGPILQVAPTMLNGPYSQHCTYEDREVVCQVTIEALETNQEPLQWDSHIDDANTIAPSQGMLMPGESITITIRITACHEHVFPYLIGPANMVKLTYSCNPPL